MISSIDITRPPESVVQELWSVNAPEPADMVNLLHCEFLWTKDSARVAIQLSPRDGPGDAALPSTMASFGVLPWHLLYVLDIQSHHMHTVATSPGFNRRPHIDATRLGKHAFAPSCTLLLVPLSRCVYVPVSAPSPVPVPVPVPVSAPVPCTCPCMCLCLVAYC